MTHVMNMTAIEVRVTELIEERQLTPSQVAFCDELACNVSNDGEDVSKYLEEFEKQARNL